MIFFPLKKTNKQSPLSFLITHACNDSGDHGVAIHKQPRPPYGCSAGVLLCLLVFGSTHQLLLLLIVGCLLEISLPRLPNPEFLLGECFSLAQLVTRLPFGSDHNVLPGFGGKPCSIVREQNSVKPSLDQALCYFPIHIVSFFLVCPP